MTWAQNRARRVNPPLSTLNHLWAESVLGIPYKSGRGCDLYDPERSIGVEIKFSKVEENKNDITWTVNREQLNYIHQCRYFFWGCGIHHPVQPVSTMFRLTSTVLERKISFRELYLVEPEWVKRTVTFRLTEGKSRTREWSSYLGNASFAKLPQVISSYRVRKGIVHFTEGVPKEKFNVQGRRIS